MDTWNYRTMALRNYRWTDRRAILNSILDFIKWLCTKKHPFILKILDQIWKNLNEFWLIQYSMIPDMCMPLLNKTKEDFSP